MIRRRRPSSPTSPQSPPPDDDDLLREILLRLPPQPSSLPRASPDALEAPVPGSREGGGAEPVQVFHYGTFEDAGEGCKPEFNEGQSVSLEVDAERRNLNSRLHSAGHLLDICMRNVGLSHLEPGKGYHFPDGAFVEYKGVIPPDQLQDKQNELEKEANELISKGAKVLASVFPYEEASKLCGGSLPSYISEDESEKRFEETFEADLDNAVEHRYGQKEDAPDKGSVDVPGRETK